MRNFALTPLLAATLVAAPAFGASLPSGFVARPDRLHGLLLGTDQLATLSGERHALEETEAYVVPRRPGKNQVRYYDFDWHHYDYLGEDGSAGIRFYFYDREVPVARIAAALVRQQWNYLETAFAYKPSTKVPYILYNSHREFEATNVFFVNEFILGVTSPLDLRMSLPYWGERERFREVSTHEMTHQFHIQKVADRAAAAGVESPIGAFPLWFTEGLAEFYAHGGIDAETDMFLRDIVLNPDGRRGYEAPGLMEDRPGDFIFTYKLGQARLAFLADRYGERVIQALLDQSPRMSGGGLRRDGDHEDFAHLLARIAAEPIETVDARWRAWLRHRVLPSYLEAKQSMADFTDIKLPDELDTFAAAPGGNVLLYRGVERETGRAKLVLFDRRDKESGTRIAIDNVPGTESLHPVLRRVAAIADGKLAYVAQSGKSDVLFLRTWESKESREEGAKLAVDFNVGRARAIPLDSDDLIEAGNLTFSPDGSQIAFVGFDRDGKEDIWITSWDHPEIRRRLTDDLFSEQDLAWGPRGIAYISDATGTGNFNLFLIDPESGWRKRLTDSPFDDRGPAWLENGDLVFSSDRSGQVDLWALHEPGSADAEVRRISDFSTGLSHPAATTDGGLLAVGFHGARFHLFEVKAAAFTDSEHATATPKTPLPARAILDEPIPDDAEPYDAFSAGNWRVEGGGAAIGGAGFGVGPVGQGGIELDDVLRDRTAIINLAVYGDIKNTDALAFYIDRAQRTTYGAALFHTFQLQRDRAFPSAVLCNQGPPPGGQAGGNPCQLFYLAREFGALGYLSYPFNTFSRIDTSLRLQGVVRNNLLIFNSDFLPTSLPTGEANDLLGFEPETAAEISYGYDTTRYGLGGAIGGGSAVLTLGGGWLPLRTINHRGIAGPDGTVVSDRGLHAYAQSDFIGTLKIIGRAKVTTRAAFGAAGGSRFARQFFVSSFDNLRGFRFNDFKLLGRYYWLGSAEASLPLDVLVRFAFFENISGIIAFDFGGVGESVAAPLRPGEAGHLNHLLSALARDAWDQRTLAFVLGANLGLGPFQLRVHFARPIGLDSAGSRYMICASQDSGTASNGCESRPPSWVPNVSLTYAYF